LTSDRDRDRARERLRSEACEFARTEVAPVADELDPVKGDIPDALVEKLAERGWFGIMVDREHGGLGLGVFEYCIVAEELSTAWMSVASVIARGQGLGTDVPDPGRRAELLRRSAAGRWIGGVAFSEAEAGSDLAGVSCAAVRDGDDYVVNGEKRWCGWALAADFILLLARTGEDRIRGLETFIVPKARGAFPDGVTGEVIPKIGYHGITSWTLRFEDVRVPATDLLQSEEGTGTGFYDTVAFLNIARIHTAARAVGAAQAALDEATAYAKQRVQFGRPIGEFQAIRFKLADMATGIEAGRRLYHHAAELFDSGARCEKECSMAKLFASEMAERATSEALQILGGNGYTTDYRVERHWRDARLTKIFEGTSEIQRGIIAKRHLDED
jgi:alkylation response protein AidB-like acyl-CoA dehydrogenase